MRARSAGGSCVQRTVGYIGADVSPEALLLVDAALGLVEPGPPALPAIAGKGARLAADRGIALIVQRVVGQVVAEDVAPQIPLSPVGQRVDLPDSGDIVMFTSFCA